MKVLSIGNSFSQDAHKWLHRLAEAEHFEMETVNLYIGGCSLKRHLDCAVNGRADYDLECNGESCGQKISISDALRMEKWDAVTLQQVSQFSGMPQTYFPYLTQLADMIRSKQPATRLCFHETWPYEIDSTHCGFAAYNWDQGEMYRRLKDAAEMAGNVIDAELIPVGTVIQTLRASVPEFDYRNGGMSLCRDGFHLSLDYGRFAAAATWYHTLTGRKIKLKTFGNFDPVLIQKIIAVIETM